MDALNVDEFILTILQGLGSVAERLPENPKVADRSALKRI